MAMPQKSKAGLVSALPPNVRHGSACRNLTGATDTVNRTTNYFYDDSNRLTRIKYPEATAGAKRLEESFTYELADNVSTKTDQAG
jgi:YD repeat-containing protein